MKTRADRARWFLALFAALASIAWLAPLPDRTTDRGVYEATAQFGIVPDCSELHCFRVLRVAPALVFCLMAASAGLCADIFRCRDFGLGWSCCDDRRLRRRYGIAWEQEPRCDGERRHNNR